jgi:hypothetical protein
MLGATAEQQKHFELAAMDRSLYSKPNNSEPGVAATPHAGVFDGAGITRSNGGTPRGTSCQYRYSDSSLLSGSRQQRSHIPRKPPTETLYAVVRPSGFSAMS